MLKCERESREGRRRERGREREGEMGKEEGRERGWEREGGEEGRERGGGREGGREGDTMYYRYYFSTLTFLQGKEGGFVVRNSSRENMYTLSIW